MWKQFRQSATGGTAVDAASPAGRLASDSEEDDDKENQPSRDAPPYRSNAPPDSSDEEFDLYLKEKATPRVKGSSKNPCSAVKKGRSQSSHAVFLSSDSDDGFEAFVNRMKTPKHKPRTPESTSEDSLKHFIVDNVSSDDDFVLTKPSARVNKKTTTTPAAPLPPVRRPFSEWDSPVFLSDDDDDNGIVMRSTWRTRHTKPNKPPKKLSSAAVVSISSPDFEDDDSQPSTPSIPSICISSHPHKSATHSTHHRPNSLSSEPPKSTTHSTTHHRPNSLSSEPPKSATHSTHRPNSLSSEPPKSATHSTHRPNSLSSEPPKKNTTHSTHRPNSLSSEPPKKNTTHSTHRPNSLSSEPPKSTTTHSTHHRPTSLSSHKPDDRCSSSSDDEEFLSLLERLKRKNVKPKGSTASPKHHHHTGNSNTAATPRSHYWPTSLDSDPGSSGAMKPPSSVPPPPGKGRQQTPAGTTTTPAGPPPSLVKGRKPPVSLTPAAGQTPLNVVQKTPRVPPPVKGPKKKGRSLGEMPPHEKTPTPGGPSAVYDKPATLSQTEPRPGPLSRVPVCRTPGCFLQSLSEPGSNYGRHFKQNKEELTARLYRLYNTTVFDDKLPADMSVTWNKKLRKTAGYCISGQHRTIAGVPGSRYARIELSDKVCDSADRLRDTLVHEMCHAATWMIHGIRDGHGQIWKMYARKATLAHPELPMVTRCHTYDITYKFQYQCVRCKNIIGRHSKSLDTERFACARCKGTFVLLNAASARPATPFANFVKENFASVRQRMAGQSHGDVMRKLSEEFSSKARLSES